MLSQHQRKLIAVNAQYCSSEFGESEWQELGILAGRPEVINNHPRLLRSLSFGDNDYNASAIEVINSICEADTQNIDFLIEHYDIELWYKSKEPKKAEKIFEISKEYDAQFWNEAKTRVFISHLASNRVKVATLTSCLQSWGVCTFVAHDDIEPSLEWLKEIEKALMTMDVLLAIVEVGFSESKWCDQEVGYAFGRNIDVIPLKNGIDPYGFMGKFQGLPIKGKTPKDIASEIIKLLLKKKKLVSKVLNDIIGSINKLDTTDKIARIKLVDSWDVLNKEDLRQLIEGSNLQHEEKKPIKEIIEKVGAFKLVKNPINDDSLPF